MTASKTIAFLYPGMMGASLARALHQRKPHYTSLTSLSGRSQASLDRAESAGLQNVPLSDWVACSDIIMSILPPSAAVDLAKDIATILPSVKRSQPPVYMEANAVAPDTVREISTILSAHGCPVIDGCVIGRPAREGYDPKIYLSCKPEWETTMRDVASTLGSDDSHSGLKITVLESAGEGGASALKMCYAGIAKGKTALATLFVLVAQAHSASTADALLGELASSQLDCLVRYAGDVADAVPKAYRWVGEMEEISSFVDTSLSVNSSESVARGIADTYLGIANIWRLIADSYKLQSKTSSAAPARDDAGSNDADVLIEWSLKAKVELAKAGVGKP